MTANKDLLALIDERLQAAFARETAAMCASLLGIAETFAQVDQRLAAMETKLERLLAERPPLGLPSARAEELIALIDERVKIALERDQHQHLEAVAGVARDVLSEFVGEFRQLRSLIEGKLAQIPHDPAARERPN